MEQHTGRGVHPLDNCGSLGRKEGWETGKAGGALAKCQDSTIQKANQPQEKGLRSPSCQGSPGKMVRKQTHMHKYKLPPSSTCSRHAENRSSAGAPQPKCYSLTGAVQRTHLSNVGFAKIWNCLIDSWTDWGDRLAKDSQRRTFGPSSQLRICIHWLSPGF